MPEEAGLDIDFDADTQLAEIQAVAAGVEPAVSRETIPGAVPGTVENIRSVELKGKSFRIADKIGAMPLLRFSTFANMNIQDPRALSAMYTLLRDVIYQGEPACGECETCAPEPCGECAGCANPPVRCYRNAPDPRSCPSFIPGEWDAFEEHAMVTKADADELMDVVTNVVELISGRPTQPPGTSSNGRRSSSGKSMASSSVKRGKGPRR